MRNLSVHLSLTLSSISPTMSTDLWQPEQDVVSAKLQSGDIYRPEFLELVKSTITALDGDLFKLSQDIHCTLMLLLMSTSCPDIKL